MSLFCFGLGYSALHYLSEYGVANAAGTVRQPPNDPDPPGVRRFVFDPADMQLRTTLAHAERILVSIPPDESGDVVLRNFAGALPRNASIVYLSSLGVYGDAHGGWVTEKADCRPQFPRSRARLAAEREWMRFAEQSGARLAILRLAGIYGPQRNALTAVRTGEARRIDKAGHVFNRIHVGDIAQAIAAAFTRRADGIFNIADDEPSPPGDPIVFAAQLLGCEPPAAAPFEQARLTMSPMALSFYEECRRADNSKMKSALGVELRYPTYREGLKALFDARDY